MRSSFGAVFALSAAALIAAACTSAIVSSEHAGDRKAARGPAIQLGQGRFSKDSKAFRYWDKAPAIAPVCAKCRAADGLATCLRDGKNPAAPHVKGYRFACVNRHVDTMAFALREAPKVSFASGAVVDTGNRASKLCVQGHPGRESTASVNKAIAGLDADTPEPKLDVLHVHDKQTGAATYGTEAKIGYEYAAKRHARRFAHAAGAATCTSCHDAHGGQVAWEDCSACPKKSGIRTEADIVRIRTGAGDRDGNGAADGAAQEIASLKKQLDAAIHECSRSVGGVQIAFSPEAFPYWYADRNGNGTVDPDERKPDDKYRAYTPRLMQAVYNDPFAIRDPGAAYDNATYTAPLLHDSLESLAQSGKAGASVQGRARP
jgi:hypothetical protein